MNVSTVQHSANQLVSGSQMPRPEDKEEKGEGAGIREEKGREEVEKQQEFSRTRLASPLNVALQHLGLSKSLTLSVAFLYPDLEGQGPLYFISLQSINDLLEIMFTQAFTPVRSQGHCLYLGEGITTSAPSMHGGPTPI